MVERLRVDQAADRLHERDAGAEEDRRDDEVAGRLLASRAAEEERDPERHGGERVAEVVDQVGEERDAVARDEDDDLRKRRDEEHDEGDRDRADARTGADDRRVDQPVAVPMAASVRVLVLGAQRSTSR